MKIFQTLDVMQLLYMRVMLLVFIMFSTSVNAQECHVKKGVDSLTKEASLETNWVHQDNIYVYTAQIRATSGVLFMHFSFSNKDSSRSYCYDKKSKATILFEDNSRISAQNRGSSGCNGIFTFRFSPAAKALATVSKKRIVAIRFHGTNHVTDIDISEDGREGLRREFECTSKELKTL